MLHYAIALRRLSIFAGSILLAIAIAAPLHAQTQQGLSVGSNEIGGTVTSSKGPEAGVWVIAETTELPTKFARLVVTDDQGRYLIPDLPTADYTVWVRGYGLVDLPKMRAKPGAMLDLTAVLAPNAAAAAHYYPAIYWYTLMKIPPASEFGGKSAIPEKLTQNDWLKQMNNVDCIGCHQLGQESTRTIPATLGHFNSGEDAWIRRVQSGQAGEMMTNRLAGQWGGVPYKYFGEWTDRIAKGEVPKIEPPRPQGLERNVVITSWEWSTPDKYLHDLISSDRRHPTVNAYGPLFGSPEYSTDNMPILDPKTNKVSFFKMPVRDADMPLSLGPGHAGAIKPMADSPYWGSEALWDTRANNHNSMFDEKGRVWLTASVRGQDNPAFCKKGSENPYAKVFPLEKSQRQVAMLDPKTMKYTFIDTCFAPITRSSAMTPTTRCGSAAPVRWPAGSTPRCSRKPATRKRRRAGRRSCSIPTATASATNIVEPNQPDDPAKDKRITAGSGPYAVMPNPMDGSIWYTIGMFAGPPGFLRFDPKTKLSEVYYVPKPGFGIRGGDIDGNGVVWGSGSSGHLMSFDRRKCKGPLNGPKATGNHCPEGWAFYKYPGPGFEGFPDNSAESSYYTWVDQHNTFGLGENIPMSTANLSDGFVALKDGKMISLRIPYPMGFYAKGLDGRIDDPNAGWKGRGLWSTNGDRTPWLMEGGKGSSPRAVHIQFRPDPLAH